MLLDIQKEMLNAQEIQSGVLGKVRAGDMDLCAAGLWWDLKLNLDDTE